MFFQVPLTLSPVTGRRLDYSIFMLEYRSDCGVTETSRLFKVCCHFNHMFHATACCVFKTAFHPSTSTPAHPASVPIRHPRDKSSVVTSFDTDKMPGTYVRGILMHVASGLFS